MKTKDGKPYTAEYAKQVLAKAIKDTENFLDGSTRVPRNKNGKILYKGMMALLDKSGDKLGNNLTDFIVAAHDYKLMEDPAIFAAAAKVAELGGARQMFQKAIRSKKVAGYKQGQARIQKPSVMGRGGILRDPTADELGTRRSKIPFEAWRKMVANDIKGRDDLSDKEKKDRIEKLANMKKGDRYTDGPKLTKEEELHEQVKEMVRSILLNKDK